MYTLLTSVIAPPVLSHNAKVPRIDVQLKTLATSTTPRYASLVYIVLMTD